MYTGVISSVDFIKNINPNADKCIITMEDLSSYVIFDKYNSLLDFVGKEVEFVYTSELVDGMMKDVIVNLNVKSIVQSINNDLSRNDIYEGSLISDENKVINVVTFDSTSIMNGDVSKSQTIFVYDVVNGKSNIAKWKDLKCLDCKSRSFNLRLFSNDKNLDEFCDKVKGKYICVDIKNTRYGLQVLDGSSIDILEQEVLYSSEVLLSSLFLNKIVNEDAELKEYVDKYNMLNKLKDVLYYEPGYHLVEMYMEISYINNSCRLSSRYNRKLLTRAVFVTRGYLVGKDTGLSNLLTNYHRLITSALKDDKELIRLLDVTKHIEVDDYNKLLFYSIKNLVSLLTKRGEDELNEENPINEFIDSINNKYNGLF